MFHCFPYIYRLRVCENLHCVTEHYSKYVLWILDLIVFWTKSYQYPTKNSLLLLTLKVLKNLSKCTNIYSFNDPLNRFISFFIPCLWTNFFKVEELSRFHIRALLFLTKYFFNDFKNVKYMLFFLLKSRSIVLEPDIGGSGTDDN